MLSALTGGMNSSAWLVSDEEMRYVFKVVDSQQTHGFIAGLRAATIVDAHGVPAGKPVPTNSGDLFIELEGGHAALLRWVEGNPLSETDWDVRVIGATLAKVHGILLHAQIPDAPAFDWVDVTAAHLDLEPWLRPAVAQALADWQTIRDSVPTWGFLHGDPFPGAFLRDDKGVCGLIDWASGFFGPCLYDLASAAMYVGPEGTRSLIEAYLRDSSLHQAEAVRGLPVLMRLRFAVQADYFARRRFTNDLTGIGDESENYKGLYDAQRMLEINVHAACGFDRP